MDSRITVRFYAVVPMEPGQPSFEACLKKIMGIGPNVAREVEGTAVQAMRLAEKAGRISGDLIRLQSDNLPSLIEARGKKPTKLPLSANAALGHHTAFLYDISLRKLAYQLTRNAVPLGLLNAYVSKVCDDCPPFGFEPVIKASELKQLNSMMPKTFLVKVADPDHLDAIEDEEKKLKASLKNLRALADGVYVKVQIGLGNNEGALNKTRLKSLVGWLLAQRDIKQGKVGTIKIIGKDFKEGDVPLDFIKAQIGESKNLTLGSSGPDENYEKRAAFIEESFDKHLDEIKKFK
jgi:hypothetical protein